MEKFDDLKRVFENNNFNFVVLESKKDVIAYLKDNIEKGAKCAVGGSVSLDECGILSLLRNGDYVFYDRYAENVDVKEIYHKSFCTDYYFSSANAITRHGEVYLVDGTGNRVAAVTYGPEKVFLVVGKNKLVNNLAEAVIRVEKTAAPLNAKRLGIDTYCASSGHCGKTETDKDNLMCSFRCKETICSSTLIMSRQRQKNRITILFVLENLGY